MPTRGVPVRVTERVRECAGVCAALFVLFLSEGIKSNAIMLITLIEGVYNHLFFFSLSPPPSSFLTLPEATSWVVLLVIHRVWRREAPELTVAAC